jgi:cell division septal protein FtsQ
MKYKYRKPHQYKRKKSIFKSRYFWFSVLLLLIVFGAFYLFCFAPYFQVSKIEISGNQKVSTQEIRELIESRIGRKILFLTSKSIFLADINSVSSELSKKFIQISKIDSQKTFPGSVSFSISERIPLAVFFQEEKSFFLDKEGIIFEQTLLGDDNLPKIIDLKNNNSLGEKVIEPKDLSAVSDLYSRMNSDFKIPVKYFKIEAPDKLVMVMREGWDAYFNLGGDMEWQITKLRAVLEEKIPPEKRKNLDYIELRFGNFAPFKY